MFGYGKKYGRKGVFGIAGENRKQRAGQLDSMNRRAKEDGGLLWG
jgi:hypothetical protein